MVMTRRGHYDMGPMVSAESALSGWQAGPARDRLAADAGQSPPVAPSDQG